MAINTNHIIEEINGIRCSVVEKNISEERSVFLKNILESSGLKVEITATETGNTIGVTDITFNVLHALYGRILKSKDGKLVTPAIWNQKAQTGDYYWNFQK